MRTNYFVLSPGRCGSILTCRTIKYILNNFFGKENYCQMQHVVTNHYKSNFDTISTVYHCHELNFNHAKHDDCDLILVLRRDMFAACLSMYIASKVFKIFTIDNNVNKENKNIFYSKLQDAMKTGINVDAVLWKELVVRFNQYWNYDPSKLKNFYKNVYTIYYEDFKNNINYISKILNIPVTNIPKDMLPEQLQYNKWNLINNKEEIINIFLQNTNIPIADFYLTNKDNLTGTK